MRKIALVEAEIQFREDQEWRTAQFDVEIHCLCCRLTGLEAKLQKLSRDHA